MQLFSVSQAQVRAVDSTDRNTFDPAVINKLVMEKIAMDPWTVKKYVTLLIFIALLVTVTFLKRMSVTDVDSPSSRGAIPPNNTQSI